MTLENQLTALKAAIDNAILADGAEGKTRIIRSSAHIQLLHEHVKSQFVAAGVQPNRLKPAVGSSRGELKLQGILMQKKQDVCVLPPGVSSPTSAAQLERAISVNVRSQLSSSAKNKETLYERTFAEAYNLHGRHKKIVLGEVYLILASEYDADMVKQKQVAFSANGFVGEYIDRFHALNSRTSPNSKPHAYERVNLIVADFSVSPVRILRSATDFQALGLSPTQCSRATDMLDTDFVTDLLAVHQTRFPQPGCPASSP